ncbi:MAG: recombinase family protein [Clostridia bacterium]|nr:recombinase family protein [Clostridia bacterium]
MKIGYARVSTNEQNLDRQIDLLKDAGVEKIYEEKITGTKRDRPELERMLDQLRKEDIIIVTELTRLSRSTKDLFEIVDTIEKANAGIKSLKESWLDTTTPQGKLMFTIFAGLSQFERDLTAQRTKDGLKSAKARGKKLGRPTKYDDKKQIVIDMYNSGNYSVNDIIKATGVSKTSLYRYVGK